MDTIERIRELCKKEGMSIAMLERWCGFANGYIGGLRKGTMPADRLQKVAEILDVPYEYLLTGEMPEKKDEYYINPKTADMAQELYVYPKPFRMLPNPSAYVRTCRVKSCFFEQTHQLCVLRQKNNILQNILQRKTPWEAVSQGAYPKGESMPVTAKK